MKKFLIAFLICLVSFTAKADLIDFIEWHKVGTANDNFLATLLNKNDGMLLSVIVKTYAATNKIEAGINDFFNVVDENLRTYADEKDYQTILDTSTSFYYSDTMGALYLIQGGGTLAAYSPVEDSIQVNPVLKNYSKSYIQSVIHHEVQHLKDTVAFDFLENGSKYRDFESMEKTTLLLHTAVFEARAYSEEAVFLYNRKEELRDKAEKLKIELDLYTAEKKLSDFSAGQMGKGYETGYNFLEVIKKSYEEAQKEYLDFERGYRERILTSPAVEAFDKAIKEGKTVEQARHIAAIEILNSNLMRDSYINEFLKAKTSNSTEILLEEFLNVLNDGKVTIEDFYAAEKFWKNICDYQQTSTSTDCQSFWARYASTHCPNIKKWSSCRRLKRILDVDKTCSANGNKKLISKEEENANEKCCNIRYFVFPH